MEIRRAIFSAFNDELSKHTILPLGSLGVNESVHLVHGDGLGIKAVDVDFGEVILTSKVRHSVLQNSIVCGLATTGGSHQHETMAHLDGVVELYDLHNEGFNGLQIEMLA